MSLQSADLSLFCISFDVFFLRLSLINPWLDAIRVHWEVHQNLHKIILKSDIKNAFHNKVIVCPKL